jgi:hypothetical protein
VVPDCRHALGSEYIKLSIAPACKQFAAMAAQTNELTEFAQKVMTGIAVKRLASPRHQACKLAWSFGRGGCGLGLGLI